MRQMGDEEYSIKFLKMESESKDQRYQERIESIMKNNINNQTSLSTLISHKRANTFSEPSKKLFVDQSSEASFISHGLMSPLKNHSFFPPIHKSAASIDTPDFTTLKESMSVSMVVDPFDAEREEIKNKLKKIKEIKKNEKMSFVKGYGRKKNIYLDHYESLSKNFSELEKYEFNKNLRLQNPAKATLESMKPAARARAREEIMTEKLQQIVGTTPFLAKYLNYYPTKIKRELLKKINPY